MSVNLSPINPTEPSRQVSNLNTDLKSDSRQSPNDSVETALHQETPTLSQSKIHVPNLSIPESSNNISIIEAFRSWIDAAREFRNQLSASDAANLIMRRKLSALSVDQALEFSKMLAEKEAAIAHLQKEIQTSLSDLDRQFQDMQNLTQQQQKEIDRLNAGNAQEKQEYNNLNQAYDRYIAQLKKVGIVPQGDGHYLIPDEPPEILEQYNQCTQEYQQAVNTFNSYWEGRSKQIDNYNQNTLIYNQKVAEYNKGVNEFISQNDLTDYLKTQKMNLPQMTEANRRDISGYLDQMESPSQINTPATLSISSPPSYAKTIAQAGPTTLAQLTHLSSFKTQTLYNELYNKKYEQQVVPLDHTAQQYINYNSFINRQQIQNVDADLSFDDILNMKQIQKLLTLRPTVSLSSSTNLIIKTFGLDNANLQSILGQVLLKEALNQSKLQALSELKTLEKQAKLEELSDQIILLSIGLLGNESVQALFPSLGIISDHLPSLPKNDPSFAILFAVSLCNRIGEDIEHGISATALETFLNASPEFTELSPHAKKQLEASLNIGQLLVSSKLLEESLGLPGLLSNLFPPLLPILNPHQMISQAQQADQQTETDLHIQIKDHFIKEGYPEEKAQFFAQMGTKVIQYGLLAPNVNANIQEKTIDYSLLKNSIKTELALSPDHTLQEADTLTDEALSRTFDHQPFSSTKQFRSLLQHQLTDLKIPHSAEIARAAVLIPPLDQSLTHNLSTLREAENPFINAETGTKSQTKTESELIKTVPEIPPLPSSTLLSSHELIAIVEKRTLQLLAPQLGTQLAKEISQEIVSTLWGKPHSSSLEEADVKSPYALVNVIKNQLDHLHAENDQNWAKAIHETFTESLKTMTSFYEFSKKLQSPAYQYIRAFSMINRDQSMKNAIDIPI